MFGILFSFHPFTIVISKKRMGIGTHDIVSLETRSAKAEKVKHDT